MERLVRVGLIQWDWNGCEPAVATLKLGNE